MTTLIQALGQSIYSSVKFARIGAAGLFAACLVAGHVQAQVKPNIVFIMADDLGWGDVSTPLTTMGQPSDFYETPAIAQMAIEGMAFTDAYANLTCAPTRSAILSGAYAPRDTNNVFTVGQWSTNSFLTGVPQGTNGSNGNIPTSTVTHAETLQSAGYTTANVGKFHVTNNSNQITTSHGFDENYGGGTSGGPGAYHASNGTFAAGVTVSLDAYAGDYTQSYVDQNIKLYANGTSLAAIDALVGTDKHVTDAQADAAIDFIDNHSDAPFFVQYSAFAVHTPIADAEARADLLDKYDNKAPGTGNSNPAYGAILEGLDQSIARIIDHLETTADPRNPGQTLDENTLVIFYSDNGGVSRYSNLNDLEGAKGTLDEGGIRVPLIAWSGNDNLVDAGTVNDTVVMPVDFFATFAGLAGATLPTGQKLDGEDLSAVFADHTTDLGRENVYWHLPGSLNSTVGGETASTLTRKGDWKLVYNYEDQSFELYDLASDIGETTDVSNTNEAVVADLGRDILDWLLETDAPLAMLTTGTLDLQIDGLAYANGAITAYDNQLVTINAGEEVPFVFEVFAALTGDYDGDGFVSQADLDLVLLNWGDGVLPAGFDENALPGGRTPGAFDGLVSQNELDGVLLNWGNGTPPNTSAVPEPGSGLLLSLTLVGLGCRQRRPG